MKRLFSLLCVVLLCMALAIQVSAAQLPRLVDGADLLSEYQEAELLEELDRVSQELQADVVIITLESCEGNSADAVIEAIYDGYDYGFGSDRDGVMLLISMAERDYRITCKGIADQAISWSDLERIGEDVAGYLSDGDYVRGFEVFIERCAYEINGERNGFPFRFGRNLVVSVVIGFVAAFIATGVMRAKLKSVRSRAGAREYTRPGSMQLTRSSDLFLYRTTDRRRKPQSDSSGSRGGGGRKTGGGKF